MTSHHGDDRDAWLTIDEIARLYDKSPSSIRLKLKEARKTANPDSICKGGGPTPDRYSRDFVVSVLKEVGPHPRGLFADIFDKRAPVVRLATSEPGEELLEGILASRMRAHNAYDSLLTDMIGSGDGLRIRCITGTDFFNAHRPALEAFRRRNGTNLEAPKVLLLYPCGHGAEVRSAAERDPDLARSQLLRDARNTFEFIKIWADELRLEVMWQEDFPLNLLVWTKQYALVEPYDHGNVETEHAGCIGRKAPIMVVKGGSPYHTSLRSGFDHVFGGEFEKIHIRTYSQQDVAKIFRSAKPSASLAYPQKAKSGRSHRRKS